MKKTIIACDVCGEKANNTITLNGRKFDLCGGCYKPFGALLGKSGHRDGRSNTSSGKTKEQLAEIRAWARKKKLKVSDRGRINKEILDAYNKAH